MQDKILLPPISELTPQAVQEQNYVVPNYQPPIYAVQVQQQQAQTFYQYHSNLSKRKPMNFSVLEDIAILKAMRLYLGKNVSLKVPWSFWQFYRKFTGSQRSDSSLYHHWNGAMVKKYGNFIKDGLIDECIAWAENSSESKQVKSDYEDEIFPVEPRMLIHSRSHQVMPSSYFHSDPATPLNVSMPRQLTHFQSYNDVDLTMYRF